MSEEIRRQKSNLECEIEEAFKKQFNLNHNHDCAGVIRGVLPDYFRQLETGEIFEGQPEQSYSEKMYNRKGAKDFIRGFLWAIKAAGIINGETFEKMYDELFNMSIKAMEADKQEPDTPKVSCDCSDLRDVEVANMRRSGKGGKERCRK